MQILYTKGTTKNHRFKSIFVTKTVSYVMHNFSFDMAYRFYQVPQLSNKVHTKKTRTFWNICQHVSVVRWFT